MAPAKEIIEALTAVSENDPSDPEKSASGLASTDRADEPTFIRGISLALIVLGLCLAGLLVGLDNSILGTAIPTITTRFNSLDDVGWYGSAYLICVCALQPISGKIFQYFSLKWAYLGFLAVFELGSLLCATSVSSVMLIIGRAVAGMGAAGLFSGALIIISRSVPLRQRPIYTGCIASMLGISNVVGPLLGGAFTQHLSWRWCFYINIPLGAITAIIMVFFFRPQDDSLSKLPISQKAKHLDLFGLILFAPAVVMLLLAMQWGGNKYAWRSATVIGLIIGFAILILLFWLWQGHQKEEASIPIRVIGQRSVYSAAVMLFLGLGGVSVMSFYMPMWFQVIKDATPVESGLRFLPFVLGNVVISIVSGGLITKFGLFNPWLFLGAILCSVAGGILSTFNVDTGDAMINGIQIMGGVGGALIMQTPLIALMSLLPQNDVPIGTSICVFFQFFGGAIFLAIGENIFVSRLMSSLHTYAPSLDAATVIAAGAEGLREVVSIQDPSALEGGVMAYNVAITDTFYSVAAGAALSLFCAFGIEWRSLKHSPDM